MDYLLEIIVYDLHEGAALDIELDYVVKMIEIVLAVVLADKIVHIHKELRRCDRAHKLGRYGIYEVDELTAKTLEIGRRY